MSKSFYPRLALTNIKKNSKTYVPYLLTCIITVMMFYIIHSLSVNKSVLTSASLSSAMNLSAGVTAVFAVIFLFYTNSFLIKQRKKEIGLYNILGLEKRHIARMMGFETLYVAVTSLAAGILGGVAFSKLIFMILLKMVHFDVKMGFAVEPKSVLVSLELFAVIFILTYLFNLWQIKSTSPVELLRGGNMGEKEPGTKILLTLFGILTLGGGYFIALTVKSPLQAMGMFFVAVILVIFGTFALFTAGSIALLKILRKNKKFYYQTRHFTAVSGMLYRMKQNAAGLATICILSTVVLVMISTTFSMYFGMEDLILNRFPKEVSIFNRGYTEQSIQNIQAESERIAKEHGLKQKDMAGYRMASIEVEYAGGNKYQVCPADAVMSGQSEMREIVLVPVEDLNAMLGTDYRLGPEEIIFYTTNEDGFHQDSIMVNEKVFTIQKELDTLKPWISSNGLIESNYLFVDSMDTVNAVIAAAGEEWGQLPAQYCYQFDLEGNTEDIVAAEKELDTVLSGNTEWDSYSIVDTREKSRDSFYELYGGLMFIGIFLGILFVMATVLIIYYKQITEGYDDKERYTIMKKVGMSTLEIRQSIRSQILIVFFLPLLTAVIHIAFAFPVVTKLLAILNLTNVPLFFITTVITVLVFAVMYAIVFAVTAREYYRIVK